MRGSFRKLISRFGKSERGTVGLLAGIAAFPMMLAAGVAIDLSHAGAVQTRLQTTLEAAALAAASAQGLTNGERIEIANAVFARNWADKQTADLVAAPKFQIQGGGIVASASVEVPTFFMKIAKFDTMDIGSEVNISIPKAKKAEVALVLDYSFSMTEKINGKPKYISMKNAAIRLVNDLKASGKDAAKIGLVPFSNMVRVTLPKAFVKGETGVGNWTGCTQDRLYPYNISDSTPDKDDEQTKWKQFVSEKNGKCVDYEPRDLIVKPLTNDFDSVSGLLNKMEPLEYTHISLGVEFGWHLLSPNAPFAEGASYGDDGTQKFLVVLTDGKQTEPAFGRISRSDISGERNLERLCPRIKDNGIIVMTIAFDLDDEDTVDRLRNCSTEPDKHFFIADDATDLAAAFSEITKQVKSKIYVSK